MKYKYFLILSTGLLCFLSTCISPYEPKGIQSSEGILAVEGMILEKGTTIKLSRTVSIYNTSEKTNSGMEDVNNAHIQVIDDRRNVMAVAEKQMIDGKINPGVYIVNTEISFTHGTKYAIEIKIGEKLYQSSFVSPIKTPEIDDITWRQNTDKSIDIMVSTHDSENIIKYYSWAYEEDWEYRSLQFGTHRYNAATDEVIEQSLFTANNRYYCWDSNTSKSIVVGTSDKLTEATIKNRVIHHFPSGNTRFSYLYSILVKQYAIDKEAYTYFDNIKKNMEQSGSIFAPMLSEIRGNIACLTNPDEPVVGYIVAAEEVVFRIFINMEQLEGEDGYDCVRNENGQMISIIKYTRADLKNLGESAGIHYVDLNTYYCSPIKCVDCTYRGGTKNKPDFWPNDHQ